MPNLPGKNKPHLPVAILLAAALLVGVLNSLGGIMASDKASLVMEQKTLMGAAQ